MVEQQQKLLLSSYIEIYELMIEKDNLLRQIKEWIASCAIPRFLSSGNINIREILLFFSTFFLSTIRIAPTFYYPIQIK